MEAISQKGYGYARKRRATKMILKLKNIGYEMRIKACGLTTLENRRLRDQIEVFKILNGYENIDRNIFVY